MELCFYECGRVATTDDHIIVPDRGGADAKENYVRACLECNGRRGSLEIGEFLQKIGLDKPVPKGITAIEYKMKNFPRELIITITCKYCQKKTLTVRRPSDPTEPKFCSKRHKKRFSAKKRPRKGV